MLDKQRKVIFFFAGDTEDIQLNQLLSVKCIWLHSINLYVHVYCLRCWLPGTRQKTDTRIKIHPCSQRFLKENYFNTDDYLSRGDSFHDTYFTVCSKKKKKKTLGSFSYFVIGLSSSWLNRSVSMTHRYV